MTSLIYTAMYGMSSHLHSYNKATTLKLKNINTNEILTQIQK